MMYRQTATTSATSSTAASSPSSSGSQSGSAAGSAATKGSSGAAVTVARSENGLFVLGTSIIVGAMVGIVVVL